MVDEKQVEDDRIDDLEVVEEGRVVRRQFKSSQDNNRRLTGGDFTTPNSSLRLDRLVLTYVRAGTSPADEYRLCATWDIPSSDDSLSNLLEPIDAIPTVQYSTSRHFRLRGDRLWPANAEPIWPSLAPFVQPGAEFGRDDLLAFCERFVIELSLPNASTSLHEPGSLELALLNELSDRIGIGRYPNQGRALIDVAALAVSLANLARTQQAILTPADVERELAIRTDFGRVAQSFPVDETVFQDRPTFRGVLRTSALAGVHQIISGPPGIGKSWELTRLAEELRETGAIVARHYCYLEPGDELIERRVTTNVFFGNLLAELHDAAPELIGAATARYAAGISELEETLTRASQLKRPVVLIVDGLDHIARVLDEAVSIAVNDTDIVERLATLDIPPGVAIVVGSQPGSHLDVVRNRWNEELLERQVPPWSRADISSLAQLHGVLQAMETAAVSDPDEITRVLTLLADRADGNPLYARYLSLGIVVGLRDGSIVNPYDWLMASPEIAGDIGGYYEYLYRPASREAQAIADVLGAIEFSVTESELREILPEFVGDWVPNALSKLAPVLTVATAQGGVRIFHESFRRFMSAEQSRQGRSPRAALEPIIAWLDSYGFYANARTYRFLLPALRRAGRRNEVVDRVEVSFVSSSVAHGHPHEAIQKNIALAADIAAADRNWAVLVRCIELQRSAYTCFDGSQNQWQHYWPAYLALFGAGALAERLLFDGHPTQIPNEGLEACSLIDDAGGTAPWREYLELDSDGGPSEANTFDINGELTSGERFKLATWHGRLAVGVQPPQLKRFRDYLKRSGNRFKPLYVRSVAARLVRMGHVNLVEELPSRVAAAADPGADITRRAVCVIRLGIADEYMRRRDAGSAAEQVTRAVEDADTPELAVSCLVYGAPAERARRVAADLSSLNIAVGTDDFLHDSSGVRTWVASVRLLATDPDRSDTLLEAERQRIDGAGWYRSWLRFVIAMAQVHAARMVGEEGDISTAFAELTRNMHPFLGSPRACDLFAIWNVIHETLDWGLSLLRTEPEWLSAMNSLSAAHNGTGSRLDREDSGPIQTGKLLDLLMPHTTNPVAGPIVRVVIEREVSNRNENGTYYGTHAEYAMRLARVKADAGDRQGALAAWECAGVYLAGYGWHKDGTIYEVIDSAPALQINSTERAIKALADLQPLTAAVITHTDHRSTKQAPNSWYRKVLQVSPPAAIAVLAQTLKSESGTGGWPITYAIRDVARQVDDSADPLLVNSVLQTVHIETDESSQVESAVNARLAPIIRLARTDRNAAQENLNRVFAELRDEARRYREIAIVRLRGIAVELGLDLPHVETSSEQNSNTREVGTFNSPASHGRGAFPLQSPPFVANPTFVDLLKGLRAAGRQTYGDGPVDWGRIVTSLSYRIPEMIDNGHAEEAERLLVFFAREVSDISGKGHPLADLAKCLDVDGHSRIAAIAYALAYTKMRGGNGWLHLGDESHAQFLARAIVLDRETALGVLAAELGYALQGSWYNAGTSRHLIQRISDWGDCESAELAWREAFHVIEHRLPLAPTNGWFARLEVGRIPDWTTDESLFALLLAKLSDPRLRNKVASLEGIVISIRNRPEIVSAGLRWWLGQHPHTTSIILVMTALLYSEGVPFAITRPLMEVLNEFTVSSLWAIRQITSMLVRRLGGQLQQVALSEQVSSDSAEPPEMNEVLRSRLLRADDGSSLEVFSELWPELSDLVLSRLHRALEQDPDSKERSGERYRLAWGDNGRRIPPTPVLLWQSEVFVESLHKELIGLSEHLWATGQWTPEIEEILLARLIPDTFVHLGLAASRVVRPSWVLPETCTDGLELLPFVGLDSPQFSGWTRLALIEKQYLTNSGRATSLQREVVRVFAGAVAAPLGRPVPPDIFPFRPGEASDWWSSSAPDPEALQFPVGQIIQFSRITDWLGDTFILIPPSVLRIHITLIPSAYGSPVTWTDESGLPALRIRTWRVSKSESPGDESEEFEGMDLIARQDIIARLELLCGVPLRQLQVVERQSLNIPGNNS